jgi:ABC-type nitrate/sulfonate/bicarbonate transport system permease component
MNVLLRLRRISAFVVIVIVWEAVAKSGWVSPILLPSIEGVLQQFFNELASQELFVHGGYSLYRAFCGFISAVIVGVTLGFVMARVKFFYALLDPLFSASYPIPKISIYPIFVFIFGFGSLSKIVLVFLECLYPMVINTYYGTRTVKQIHVWSAQNMGASDWQIFWRIILPGASPFIFSGLRVAMPISLIIVIITEMIGAGEGLGYMIEFSRASFETPTMYVGILSIAIIGYLLDVLLVRVRARVIFWERLVAVF